MCSTNVLLLLKFNVVFVIKIEINSFRIWPITHSQRIQNTVINAYT